MKKIAIFGEINTEMRIRPFFSSPLTVGKIDYIAGGEAFSIAKSIAKLGGAPKLVATIGRDDAGKYLIDCAEKARVDTSCCIITDGDSAKKAYIFDERERIERIVTDSRIYRGLSVNALPKTDEFDLCIIAGSLEKVADKFMLENAQSPVMVCLSGIENFSNYEGLWSKIHSLVMTKTAAEHLVGFALETDDNFGAAIDIMKKNGVVRVFITRDDGVYYGDPKGFCPIADRQKIKQNDSFAALAAGFALNSDKEITSQCILAVDAASAVLQ